MRRQQERQSPPQLRSLGDDYGSVEEHAPGQAKGLGRGRRRFSGITIRSDLHLQGDAVVSCGITTISLLFWSRGIGGREGEEGATDIAKANVTY